jgi:hypothetical protein
MIQAPYISKSTMNRLDFLAASSPPLDTYGFNILFDARPDLCGHIFAYITTRDVGAFRAVSRVARNAVEEHPWDEMQTRIAGSL